MLRGFLRFRDRWLRRFWRLWGYFFVWEARVATLRDQVRGADILSFHPDGSIRLSHPTGPLPLRPVIVANARFSTNRTQRMARRAAASLFDHYDLGVIPAQFWPIFERTFDPGEAMDAFLLAVGCSSNRFRQRDPDELSKVREITELFLRSGNILHRLSPEVRRIVGLQLETGEHDKIKTLAEVAAHLDAAVDLAAPWNGKVVVASFGDLLRVIERLLSDPLTVAAADAASTVGLVAQFADAQRHFDALIEQFDSLSAALAHAWPEVWLGASPEEALRTHTGEFERVAETMRNNADLTFENLHEGNTFLYGCIAELETLLGAARRYNLGDRGSDPGGPTGDADHRTGGRRGHSGRDGARSANPPDEIDVALRFFGFSRASPPGSKKDLNSVFRKTAKTVHPDSKPDASDDERRRLHDQFVLCSTYYNRLLVHFSWH
ncbi:hypothetical protein ACQR0V_25490 [Bradyrhizobium sp. HKCCYLS2058]|uniref:hypothetical protein n=1 Tax=unclassified Bradyrhizobium TaxID=2631580 RepID=UPI003EBD8E28